jgi:hypothetical protein
MATPGAVSHRPDQAIRGIKKVVAIWTLGFECHAWKGSLIVGSQEES